MKKLIVGSAITASVIVLGLFAGYWHFADLLPRQSRFDAASVPASEPRPAEAEPSVELGRVEPAGEPQATPADAPNFELLRVEPDGGAVVAGRASPGSEVRLLSGGEVLASERASEAGDFVLALSAPLAVGDHELKLETTGPGGEALSSAEAAIVSVPERGREDELLVALGAPSAPTRFLARPAPPESVEAVEAVVLPQEAEPLPAEPVVAPEETAVEPVRETPAPELSIAAVEIDRDRIFVAGTARPGGTVRVYLDDAYIAEGRAEGEAFIAEARGSVEIGTHTVRADEIDADGSVVARVEVPFDRPEGTSMAALAPDLRSNGSGPASEPVAAVAVREEGGTPGGPATQAALEPVEGRVIIRRGDTLWRISRDTYGAGRRYTTIYLANGDQIRDPDLIYPGQIFRLPEDEDGRGSRPR